jgi:hypothetical protein
MLCDLGLVAVAVIGTLFGLLMGILGLRVGIGDKPQDVDAVEEES